MADIVERLAGPFIAEPAAQRVMDQAIEEIEHLREWNAEIALNAREFAAENERLRAALREAYEVYAGSDGFIPETAGEGYQQQIIKQMVDCICSALVKQLTTEEERA